jgi:hypothetical protein
MDLKYLTFEEYMDCDNWKDYNLIKFNKDIVQQDTKEVVFKADELYLIELTKEDENVIYVQMPNSKSCCSVPITDDLKFVALWEYEYKLYVRKKKKELKEANEVTISKERYEELLYVEAKYWDLCD